MNPTWHSTEPPLTGRIGAGGWLRAVLRGGVLFAVVYGGLLALLGVRLLERPLCGLRRPVSPAITRAVCRMSLGILGLRLHVIGRPMASAGAGALVANHASWLDIFTLNAAQRLYFVSKAEVAAWPGIGWLARATGTVFISRNSREASAQKRLFEDRLRAGHRLAFFPEGTSTDGQRVLPFKSTLFAAFFAEGLRDGLRLQPISVTYHAPDGEEPRFYGWWGDMDFGPHFLKVLAARRQGRVDVVFHPPVRVADFTSRKALAAHCEAEVRHGMTLRH
jgi:1-acyl-sn-glycerol-3-phosphate acyltransferase